MSIESKQLMMHDLSKRFGEVLTVSQCDAVMRIISEVSARYEIDRATDAPDDVEGSELLEAFISAKRVEGRSEKTIERYRRQIEKVQEELNVPIREITVFHVRRFFASEKARGISDRSLEGTREILSSYFGWLQKEGLLQKNPISNLGPIKYAKIKRTPYTDIDIEKLKECCKTDRDKALVNFLLSTGCRVSEVCSLNRDDINLTTKECIVMGKGAKERQVFLNDVTAMHVQRYLATRKDSSEALFVGKGSERLTPGGVRALLNRLAGKAGLQGIHPHRFRRTLATRLIDHGMPIQEVATILGHDKIDTTMTYVYIDGKNVRNSYNKYA